MREKVHINKPFIVAAAMVESFLEIWFRENIKYENSALRTLLSSQILANMWLLFVLPVLLIILGR